MILGYSSTSAVASRFRSSFMLFDTMALAVGKNAKSLKIWIELAPLWAKGEAALSAHD